MTDFLSLKKQYPEEVRLVEETINRWVRDRVLPMIATHFESNTFPTEWTKTLAEMGLFGLTLPVEVGGANMSYLAYGVACQALEKGDSGIRSAVSVQSSLCMYPIYSFGTKAQQQKFLPAMAEGRLIGCFGLTEPDAGSDPQNMLTKADKVEGGYVLNGSKLWITNATIADVAIVWAKTDSGVRGFLVEKEFEGFSAELIKHKWSLNASITGGLVLKDCFVPEDNLLPGTEIGLKAPLSCLTRARYGIAWGAVGAAMACYEAALDYTANRDQFGKSLTSFQLIQYELVEMLREITLAQAYNLQLAQRMDDGTADHVLVSMGKLNACDKALKIARSARNLLGANGISLEYPVVRHMANLEAVFTYEGTDNMHHLIVGRAITGKSAFV